MIEMTRKINKINGCNVVASFLGNTSTKNKQNWWKNKIEYFFFYFSFLVPPDCYPGRLGFLLTIFLVLVNMFMGILYIVPMTDGINFMALWLLTCIFFVFAALLEYAIILSHKSIMANKIEDKGSKTNLLEQSILSLDKYALICFPLAFFLFLVIFSLQILFVWLTISNKYIHNITVVH